MKMTLSSYRQPDTIEHIISKIKEKVETLRQVYCEVQSLSQCSADATFRRMHIITNVFEHVEAPSYRMCLHLHLLQRLR